MQHSIECNIVDDVNQLSFTYEDQAPELCVFVSPPNKFTKIVDFIYAIEEKQEVWYKMMTISARSRYYNPAQRPLPYKLPLPS